MQSRQHVRGVQGSYNSQVVSFCRRMAAIVSPRSSDEMRAPILTLGVGQLLAKVSITTV